MEKFSYSGYPTYSIANDKNVYFHPTRHPIVVDRSAGKRAGYLDTGTIPFIKASV